MCSTNPVLKRLKKRKKTEEENRFANGHLDYQFTGCTQLAGHILFTI